MHTENTAESKWFCMNLTGIISLTQCDTILIKICLDDVTWFLVCSFQFTRRPSRLQGAGFNVSLPEGNSIQQKDDHFIHLVSSRPIVGQHQHRVSCTSNLPIPPYKIPWGTKVVNEAPADTSYIDVACVPITCSTHVHRDRCLTQVKWSQFNWDTVRDREVTYHERTKSCEISSKLQSGSVIQLTERQLTQVALLTHQKYYMCFHIGKSTMPCIQLAWYTNTCEM